MRGYFILLILIILSARHASAQTKKFPSNKEDKKIFEEAENWFLAESFDKALQLYKKLEPNNATVELLLFRIGVCYLKLDVDDINALAYLTKANTGALNQTEFHYYYGEAMHQNLKFDEAIEQFNFYLAIKKKSKELTNLAIRKVEQCNTGKKLIQTPIAVTIINVGAPINSADFEYAPLISSDESVLLFTYKGELSNGGLQVVDPNHPDDKEYYEDVFITLKDSIGNWIKPYHLDNNINSEGNDACIAISSDAQEMFMFRSIENDPGSIYRSVLDGIFWSDPELVEGKINSPEWDGGMTISANGKTAYFSSERKGGFGNRDLYVAKKDTNGNWGNIKNLGASINSEFNEDSPFLHPSGQYLIFGSDGKNTMGGYDIFVSELQKDSSWGVPQNIGYPVNTPGNDKFYSITADGKHGYFASNKRNGNGKFDIYIVEPGLADRPIHLVQVKGILTINGEPVMGRINVSDSNTGLIIYTATSNSYTGKYLVDLPAGLNYKLTYDVGGFDPEILTVNAVGITAFKEIIHDIDFGREHIEDGNTVITTTPKKDSVVSTNDIKTIPKEKLLLIEHPSLVYRVQIGAYRFPWNFKYKHVMQLGKKDEKEKLDDDITRFTLGRFNTLQEAYEFKDKVVKEGIGDTFVTAIFNGKRYLLTELGPILYETLKNESAYQPLFKEIDSTLLSDK